MLSRSILGRKNGNRFADAAQGMFAHGIEAGLEVAGKSSAYRFCQEQGAAEWFAQGFHPAGLVDGASDHREVEPFLTTDIAEEDFTPVKADTDL